MSQCNNDQFENQLLLQQSIYNLTAYQLEEQLKNVKIQLANLQNNKEIEIINIQKQYGEKLLTLMDINNKQEKLINLLQNDKNCIQNTKQLIQQNIQDLHSFQTNIFNNNISQKVATVSKQLNQVEQKFSNLLNSQYQRVKTNIQQLCQSNEYNSSVKQNIQQPKSLEEENAKLLQQLNQRQLQLQQTKKVIETLQFNFDDFKKQFQKQKSQCDKQSEEIEQYISKINTLTKDNSVLQEKLDSLRKLNSTNEITIGKQAENIEDQQQQLIDKQQIIDKQNEDMKVLIYQVKSEKQETQQYIDDE